mgnify:CR=1 FL=1
MLRDFERENLCPRDSLGHGGNFRTLNSNIFGHKNLTLVWVKSQRLVNWINRVVYWKVFPWWLCVHRELTLATGCSSLQSEGRELTGSLVRETWDGDRSRERGQPGLFRQAWTNSIKFTESQSYNTRSHKHNTASKKRLHVWIRDVLWHRHMAVKLCQFIFNIRHKPTNREYQFCTRKRGQHP